MSSKTTRKCGKCGEKITIDRQSLNNIVYYQNKFYHIDCFVEKANQGMDSTRYAAHWQEILNRLPEFQAEAKRRLEHYMIRDEFNDYLLANYDVYAVSERFWNIAEDISNGIYKRKKCKAIDMQTLMDAWKWGQKKLDKIAANNKAKNKGPQNDEQRLNYDLAIILQHIGDYKKHVEKEKVAREEIIQATKKQPKIDYSSLNKNTQTKTEIDTSDMSVLINEIF